MGRRATGMSRTQNWRKSQYISPESRAIGFEAMHWRERTGLTMLDVARHTKIAQPDLVAFEKTGMGMSDPRRRALEKLYGAPENTLGFSVEPEEVLDLDIYLPGALVQSHLEDVGQTRKWLADQCGLNPSVITNTFKGDRIISAERAIQFADALGTDPHLYAAMQAVYDVEKLLREREENKNE